MTWLETYGATNKVSTANRSWEESFTSWFGTTSTVTRTVTEAQYEYVGMTQSTANTCMAAMVLAGYSAHAQAENNGGGWKVIVIEVSYGEWS